MDKVEDGFYDIVCRRKGMVQNMKIVDHITIIRALICEIVAEKVDG
jgi:hypothetical protein